VNCKHLYLQTVNFIEDAIKRGEYSPGDVLPSDIELAQMRGVSITTVRRAYQDLVKRGWVRRIKKKGTVLNDITHGNSPKKIGVIVISDTPPFAKILGGINNVLSSQGIPYIKLYNHESHEECEKCIQHCLKNEFTGLIVSPPDPDASSSLRKLSAEGFPVVIISRYGENFHCVHPDDHKCGFLVGEHFLRCGYRHPAAIYRDKPFSYERLYGFREALALGGLRLPDERTLAVSYEDVQVINHNHFCEREADWLLTLNPRPDAVFVFNDHYASGIYHRLLHRGVRVPKDIAIAGVDNLPQNQQPFPLTTVDNALDKIGERAAQILLGLHHRKPEQFIKEKIAPVLIVRSSTHTLQQPVLSS
jgi:GntR family transcriptional regulator of arabinose operon